MIEFRQARKEYGSIVALKGLDLAVAAGETVCLIGTSGSGKTTAMKMVNRLVEPTSGKVLVNGEDVAETDPIALRRSIGYVIQRGGLFPHMTVSGNVGLLCRLEGWPKERVKARVNELLDLVDLSYAEFAHRYPGELSGGQQQRVSIARALAFDHLRLGLARERFVGELALDALDDPGQLIPAIQPAPGLRSGLDELEDHQLHRRL